MTGETGRLKLIRGSHAARRAVAAATILLTVNGWGQQAPTAGPPSPSGVTPAASPAAAAPSVDELEKVRAWLTSDAAAPRCNLATLVMFLGRAYAACRDDGLLVIGTQPSPTLLEQRNLGGSVVALTERTGALEAQILKTETQWVAGVVEAPTVAPVAPVAAPQPVPPPPEKRVGRVIAVKGENVIIDLGTQDGVNEHTNVELYTLSKDGEVRRVAVGAVRATSARRARIELGPNEEAPLETLARTTSDALSASYATPPRSLARYTAQVLVRPFLGLSSGGGGVLLDASLVRRFRAPFTLGAAVMPIGYGRANDQDTSTFSGMVFATYDIRWFEGGLGLGMQTVNDSRFFAPGTGTLLPVFLRFGAADGANLHGRVDFTVFHSQVLATGLRLELDVMLDRGVWLILGGGGGPSGFTLGEVGIKKSLTGNGNAGTHSIVIVTGGSAVHECSGGADSCGNELNVSGAHLGVGLESRF